MVLYLTWPWEQEHTYPIFREHIRVVCNLMTRLTELLIIKSWFALSSDIYHLSWPFYRFFEEGKISWLSLPSAIIHQQSQNMCLLWLVNVHKRPLNQCIRFWSIHRKQLDNMVWAFHWREYSCKFQHFCFLFHLLFLICKL